MIEKIASKEFYNAMENVAIAELKKSPWEHAHEICSYWSSKANRLERELAHAHEEIIKLEKKKGLKKSA